MPELTYEKARTIRAGILLAQRNYAQQIPGISYDDQQPPRGLLRKAYQRTWGRCVGGASYFPPRASSTRRNPKAFGPSVEEKLTALYARVNK